MRNGEEKREEEDSVKRERDKIKKGRENPIE